MLPLFTEGQGSATHVLPNKLNTLRDFAAAHIEHPTRATQLFYVGANPVYTLFDKPLTKMADQYYLFVDGAYLRQRHFDSISQVFSKPAKLDLSRLRRVLQAHKMVFQRAFYYDCLDDIVKTNETEDALKKRIAEQEEFFDRIQSIDGFHLGLGSLSGTSKKKRQKEVDILLAVEMLDHAFRRNMTSAGLIAGDLDFKPLVESLVRLGTWVDVFYDPSSVAAGLLASADRGVALGFQNYYLMSEFEFCRDNPLPVQTDVRTWQDDAGGLSLSKRGSLQTGEAVELYEGTSQYALIVRQTPHPTRLTHSDGAVLENYFAVTHSPIQWHE
jgi:uncharacterized LabA/DUF88 family protein